MADQGAGAEPVAREPPALPTYRMMVNHFEVLTFAGDSAPEHLDRLPALPGPVARRLAFPAR
ncbi:hypothetical protein BH23GEM6_BH23GEM6_24360 [soil metagenome]